MQNFNVEAAGQKIYLNFGQDISTYTALNLKLQPRFGDLIEKTPTLGTANVTVEDAQLLANQYVEYTLDADIFTKSTVNGETIPRAGKWRAKAIATLPAETVATDYMFFRVMP